jgi:hypothetical protein
LEDISAIALYHRVLLTKVNLHPCLLNLLFVLSSKYLPYFQLRYFRVAIGTSGIFEFRFTFLTASYLQTGFSSVILEATYVERMKTLRLHEHSDILSLFIFGQDLSIAVLAKVRITWVWVKKCKFLFLLH